MLTAIFIRRIYLQFFEDSPENYFIIIIQIYMIVLKVHPYKEK